MSEIKTHKDLIVWQKSVAFVTEIYKTTASLPDDEKFGIISQLRRAAVSIPTNISEGAARHSTKEFIQFLYISLGSISEIDTLLLIAGNLKYTDSDDLTILQHKADEIKKMLTSLIKSLKNN
jgi:four helix bundle protein